MKIKHRILTKEGEQIWSEFYIENPDEIKLVNYARFASDCYIVFDRKTKNIKTEKSYSYLHDSEYLGVV